MWPRNRRVLSVVERGWRGARACSLALAEHQVGVTQLIKGSLDPELQALISPHEAIRLVSMPRVWFRVGLWWWLGMATATRQLRWVVVDHERTLREIGWWCRVFGITLLTIHEHDEGFELFRGQARVGFATVFGV